VVTGALSMALVFMAALAAIGWRNAFYEESQKRVAQQKAAERKVRLRVLDEIQEGMRKRNETLASDLRDATERVMTMKRDGFDAGMPKIDEEEEVELSAELEGFIGKVRSPQAADALREEAEDAVSRGQDPSEILERFRQGRPIWDSRS